METTRISHASPFPTARALFGSVSPGELSPLVTSSTQEQFLRLVRDLELPVQTACYECRLSGEDHRVDLALCVFPGFMQSALASLRRAHGKDPAWGRALGFLRDWSTPELLLQIPFVWLAFDLDHTQATLPTPCLGLCVDRNFFARRLGQDFPPASSDELVCLANDSFQRFQGTGLPTSLTERLFRSVNRSIEPKHLSFMLGRSPATFKLDVRLPAANVEDFLTRLGWPSSPARIQKKILEFMPWPGHVQLNLVLHPELRGPLEVEFMTIPSEVSPEQRYSFLTRLEELELCDGEKAEILRRSWARPLRTTLGGLRVARSWYVKIRFEEDLPVEAKAYLGLIARPLASPQANSEPPPA